MKKFDFIIPYKHWRLDKNWIIDTNKTLLKNNPLIQFSDEEKNSIKKILEEKNIDLKKTFFVLPIEILNIPIIKFPI